METRRVLEFNPNEDPYTYGNLCADHAPEFATTLEALEALATDLAAEAEGYMSRRNKKGHAAVEKAVALRDAVDRINKILHPWEVGE